MSKINFVLEINTFNIMVTTFYKAIAKILMPRTIGMVIAVCSLWSCHNKEQEQGPQVKHVVVIGVDGLSPNGLQKAVTPTLIRSSAKGLPPCMPEPYCRPVQVPIGRP